METSTIIALVVLIVVVIGVVVALVLYLSRKSNKNPPLPPSPPNPPSPPSPPNPPLPPSPPKPPTINNQQIRIDGTTNCILPCNVPPTQGVNLCVIDCTRYTPTSIEDKWTYKDGLLIYSNTGYTLRNVDVKLYKNGNGNEFAWDINDGQIKRRNLDECLSTVPCTSGTCVTKKPCNQATRFTFV